MKIRKAKISDFKEIKKAHAEITKVDVQNRNDLFCDEAFTFKHYMELLMDPKSKVFVAVKNKKVIGSVILQIDEMSLYSDYYKRVPYIYSLYVNKANRHNGVATQLINECKKCAQKYSELYPDKYEAHICLDVMGFNKNAIKLYENLGFKPRVITYEMPLEKENGPE